MAISGTVSDANLTKMNNAVVEVDIIGTGVTWEAIESWANTVEPTRGKIPTSTDPTLDGEKHLSVGQQDVSRVKVTLLYDEVATGPAANMYALLGLPVDIRWSKDGDTGSLRYSTSGGKLIDCTAPGFSASDNANSKIVLEIESANDIAVAAIA